MPQTRPLQVRVSLCQQILISKMSTQAVAIKVQNLKRKPPLWSLVFLCVHLWLVLPLFETAGDFWIYDMVLRNRLKILESSMLMVLFVFFSRLWLGVGNDVSSLVQVLTQLREAPALTQNTWSEILIGFGLFGVFVVIFWSFHAFTAPHVKSASKLRLCTS